MSNKRLNAQQLLESIVKDDSASDSDDSIELRLETSDEEAKEVENDDDEIPNNLITTAPKSNPVILRTKTAGKLFRRENVQSKTFLIMVEK